MPPVPIEEIVAFVGGRYEGPGDVMIHGVATLADATPQQISFLSNPKYADQIETTRAFAVLVADTLAGDSPKWIRVPNPYAAMAKVLAKWFAGRPHPSG